MAGPIPHTEGRLLQATFTLQDGKTLLRVIPVRDMSRKERGIADEAEERASRRRTTRPTMSTGARPARRVCRT